jgi:hypothetical protein
VAAPASSTTRTAQRGFPLQERHQRM